MRIRRVATIVVMSLCVFGAMVSCSDKKDSSPEKTTPAPGKTPSAKVNASNLGAAAKIPADVAFYQSAVGLGKQVDAIRKSNAAKNIMNLPLVQQLTTQLQMQPGYMQFMAFIEQNPMAVEGLPVLKDMVSNEIFFCGGKRLTDVIQAYSIMNSTIFAGQFQNGFQAGINGRDVSEGLDPELVVDAVLSVRDDLEMPPLLVGFKLTNPQAAEAWLKKYLTPMLRNPALRPEAKKINGAEFLTLTLKGEDIPDLEGLNADPEFQMLPLQKRTQFLAFLRQLTLTVAIGVKDDYLLLSIGKDTSMLSRWGQGPSLAEAKEFAPLRKHYKPELLSISYTSKAVVALMTPNKAEMRKNVLMMIDMIPDQNVPQGLKPQLTRDANKFFADLSISEPRYGLTFSFVDGGIETYSLGSSAKDTLLDFTAPLDILRYRTDKPFAFSAQHMAKLDGQYDTFVEWGKTLFGYFETYLLPELEPSNRKGYDKIMAVVAPFLKKVDAVTRTKFLPSINGIQSMLIIDGQGLSPKAVPEIKAELAQAIPLLRFGGVMKLNDASQFLGAMEEYRQSVNAVIANFRKAFPEELDELTFTIPSPRKEKRGGGTLYYYPLPLALGDDLFPCSMLKDNLLILASSSKMAASISQPRPMPTNPRIPIDQAAGGAMVVEFGAGLDFLKNLTNAVLVNVQTFGELDQAELTILALAKVHWEGVLRSMRVFRSYTSVTTLEDGREITHSWLKIEDIAP